jgi:hypothetical protein
MESDLELRPRFDEAMMRRQPVARFLLEQLYFQFESVTEDSSCFSIPSGLIA